MKIIKVASALGGGIHGAVVNGIKGSVIGGIANTGRYALKNLKNKEEKHDLTKAFYRGAATGGAIGGVAGGALGARDGARRAKLKQKIKEQGDTLRDFYDNLEKEDLKRSEEIKEYLNNPDSYKIRW